jgi:hypothetical protein
MPPRGVKKGTKDARKYEHIKESEKDAGRSEKRAKEIASSITTPRRRASRAGRR